MFGCGVDLCLISISYVSPSIDIISINSTDKKKVKKFNKEKLKWLKNLMAGGIAGAISRTLTAPLERLKILYQVNYKGSSNPPNILKGLNEIIVRDGFTGLFRGNLINTLKASPETSIKLASFEYFKHLLNIQNADNKTNLTKPQLFFCGASSGLISSFCVFPLDMLKTRFAAVPTGTYKSIVDAVRTIFRTEGIKPFFNGFQATLCAALPNSGINLMTYEFIKSSFTKYYKEKKERDAPLPTFMVAGAISSLFSSSLMYPWQLITSRIIMYGFQKQGLKKKGMLTTIKEIKFHEGYIGFYKGFIPAMTKILFGNGIAFYAYEVCKKKLNI